MSAYQNSNGIFFIFINNFGKIGFQIRTSLFLIAFLTISWAARFSNSFVDLSRFLAECTSFFLVIRPSMSVLTLFPSLWDIAFKNSFLFFSRKISKSSLRITIRFVEEALHQNFFRVVLEHRPLYNLRACS